MPILMDCDTNATAGNEATENTMHAPIWEVEVDRATPEQWAEMLELLDDANIYQTAAYGGVRWGEKNLSRLVLKRDGEVAGIAQLRIVRPTPLRFGMAYLRWGPLWARRGRPLDTEVCVRMARALEEEYVGNRRLFLRVLPNAFVGTPRAAAMRAAFGRLEAEAVVAENTYRTFVLDLAPTLEELRKGLHKTWRRHLSHSEKNSLTVVAGSGMEEYRTFCKMYHEMWNRKTFETTVDVAEFGRIQESLPEPHRMRILICEDKSVAVAGLVVSVLGDSAIYLLAATSNDGLNSGGAYLTQWTMIKWLKEKGIRWYDLGGIDPERNPGVYQFKRGFAGTDVTQLSPMVACRSKLSSAVVKAGLAIQRAVRGSRSSAARTGHAAKRTETSEPA